MNQRLGIFPPDAVDAPERHHTSYSYDNLPRLLSVLDQAGMNTIDGATCTVDAAGNRTSEIRAQDADANGTRAWDCLRLAS